MKIENIKIADLKPYARNAKAHPPEQVAKIARSIREFGFTIPIVIDAENVIVAGHGRLLAATSLDFDRVPCVRVAGLSPEQIKTFRIADNKVSESEWIEDILLEELKDMDITLAGFSEMEINRLSARLTLDLSILPETGSGTEKTKKIICPKCGFEYAD